MDGNHENFDRLYDYPVEEWHGNKVDFIVTHCCASSTQILLGGAMYKPDVETAFLEEIRQSVNFKKWFFGHYHDNRNVNADELKIIIFDPGID